VKGQCIDIILEAPTFTSGGVSVTKKANVARMTIDEGIFGNTRLNNRVDIEYIFDDSALRPLNHVYNSIDANVNYPSTKIGYYEPVQSFTKTFNSINGNGTWKLYLLPRNANTTGVSTNLGINVGNVSLEVTHAFKNTQNSNTVQLSSICPSISLNKETQYFSWLAPEGFLKNCQIKLGARLKTILQLNKNNFNEYVDFPVCDLTGDANNILQIVADVPRLFMMSDIDELIISSSMNINKDYLSDVREDVITSFPIDSSEIFKLDDVTFYDNMSSIPFNKYKILSNGLRKVDLTFNIKLKNGSIVPVFIESGESMLVKINLFQIDDFNTEIRTTS
jgi:hypothetical protein